MNTWNREWKPPRRDSEPPLTKGDQREIYGSVGSGTSGPRSDRPRRRFSRKRATRESVDGDRRDLAMKHVAFIVCVSTSAHERDVREIQIGA